MSMDIFNQEKDYPENMSAVALALGIAVSDDKTEGRKCSYNKYHNNSRFF
jgi:hypothetical protein